MEADSALDAALKAHERQVDGEALARADLLDRFDALGRDFLQRYGEAGYRPHTILHLGDPIKSVERMFGGRKSVPSGVPQVPVIIVAVSISPADCGGAQPSRYGTVMALDGRYYFAQEGDASYAAVLGESNGWHPFSTSNGPMRTPTSVSEEALRLLARRFAELLRNVGRPVIRPLHVVGGRVS